MKPVKYINKVFIKGYLGKDPDLRFMPSGDPVCNFSVATRSGKHVEWHKFVAFDTTAEMIKESFFSGDLVYLEAEIKSREFLTAEDKKHGRKPRKVTELIVLEAHLVSKRTEATESEPADVAQDEEGDDMALLDSVEGGGSVLEADGVGSPLPKFV